MTLPPQLRKLTLSAHVVFSVGWIGALAGFLALSLAGLSSQDPQTVRAAYVASGLITGFVVVPLALASLLSGLVQALATPWGLFRHYWVLFKLLISVTAAVTLLMKAGPIGYIADVAAATTLSSFDLRGLRVSLAVHAVGGLLVLLWVAVLGICKPQGLTRYGWRKQRAQADAGHSTRGGGSG
ncbi:MAG: hypothetical protein ACREQZ_07685 [Woeseiaceae bacterium]